MLSHYLTLSTFIWMFMEGIQLYLMLAYLFLLEKGSAIKKYTLIAYGVPLVIIIFSKIAEFLLINLGTYSTNGYCWLSDNLTFNLVTFVTPVTFVFLANTFMFIILINKRHKKNGKKNKLSLCTKNNNNCSFFRSLFNYWYFITSLLTLMWIGVVVLVFDSKFTKDSFVVFIYMFYILNSCQGSLIFVIICILSRKFRDQLLKRESRRRNSRNQTTTSLFTSSSTTNSSSSPFIPLQPAPLPPQMHQQQTFARIQRTSSLNSSSNRTQTTYITPVTIQRLSLISSIPKVPPPLPPPLYHPNNPILGRFSTFKSNCSENAKNSSFQPLVDKRYDENQYLTPEYHNYSLVDSEFQTDVYNNDDDLNYVEVNDEETARSSIQSTNVASKIKKDLIMMIAMPEEYDNYDDGEVIKVNDEKSERNLSSSSTNEDEKEDDQNMTAFLNQFTSAATTTTSMTEKTYRKGIKSPTTLKQISPDENLKAKKFLQKCPI